MKKLLPVLLLIIYTACTSVGQPVTKEDVFPGTWKYTKSNRKADASMNGVLAVVNKLQGTTETYNFSYLGFDLLFTKKNDSTLIGSEMKDSYINYLKGSQLKLYIDADNIHYFTKLK